MPSYFVLVFIVFLVYFVESGSLKVKTPPRHLIGSRLRAGSQQQSHTSPSSAAPAVVESPLSGTSSFDQIEKHIHNTSEFDYLCAKYPNKIVVVQCDMYPLVDIILCGTLHVSEASVNLVKEAIFMTWPNFVVLELCAERITTLMEPDPQSGNFTFNAVLAATWQARTWSALGMNLLGWLQETASQLHGSKVGGEQYTASKAAHAMGAAVVLGDRAYSVTMQRLLDRLNAWQKVQMVALIAWETLTCSAKRVADFIRSSNEDAGFVQREMEDLARQLPAVAEVLVRERDEYLAQSIHQVARIATGKLAVAQGVHGGIGAGVGVRPGGAPGSSRGRGRILAVLGAAHLPGVRRHLLEGGVSGTRVREIAGSSQHISTWPGEGMLQVVNTTALYEDNPELLLYDPSDAR